MNPHHRTDSGKHYLEIKIKKQKGRKEVISYLFPILSHEYRHGLLHHMQAERSEERKWKKKKRGHMMYRYTNRSMTENRQSTPPFREPFRCICCYYSFCCPRFLSIAKGNQLQTNLSTPSPGSSSALWFPSFLCYQKSEFCYISHFRIRDDEMLRHGENRQIQSTWWDRQRPPSDYRAGLWKC